MTKLLFIKATLIVLLGYFDDIWISYFDVIN